MRLLKLFRREVAPSEWPIRHTVKVMPRETLRTIAEREYGDQHQWQIIFERNKWRFDDEDPLAVYPGMDLDIPEPAT